MDLFKGLFEHVRAKASESICPKCGRKSKETYEGLMECTGCDKLVTECNLDPLPGFKVMESPEPVVRDEEEGPKEDEAEEEIEKAVKDFGPDVGEKTVKEEASNDGIASAKKIAATSASKSKSEVSKEKSATVAGASQQDALITKAVGPDVKTMKSDNPSDIQKQGEPDKDPTKAGKGIAAKSASASKSDVSAEKSAAKAVNAAANKKNAQSSKE